MKWTLLFSHEVQHIQTFSPKIVHISRSLGNAVTLNGLEIIFLTDDTYLQLYLVIVIPKCFLPERDYVTFGSLLSQFRLSSV